jgi:hypothetical protein
LPSLTGILVGVNLGRNDFYPSPRDPGKDFFLNSFLAVNQEDRSDSRQVNRKRAVHLAFKITQPFRGGTTDAAGRPTFLD